MRMWGSSSVLSYFTALALVPLRVTWVCEDYFLPRYSFFSVRGYLVKWYSKDCDLNRCT